MRTTAPTNSVTIDLTAATRYAIPGGIGTTIINPTITNPTTGQTYQILIDLRQSWMGNCQWAFPTTTKLNTTLSTAPGAVDTLIITSTDQGKTYTAQRVVNPSYNLTTSPTTITGVNLGQAIQAHPTRPVDLIASIDIAITAIGTVEAQLQASPDNTTWTIVDRLKLSGSALLGVTIGTVLTASPLNAGWWYRIQPTQGTTTSVTLNSITETIL